jgi:death-on-curing protein
LIGRPRLITVEDLIALNQRIAGLSGGTTGVRDMRRVEYAVQRPFDTFAKRSVYRTPYDKAAAIMEIIIRGQPFEAANKATAVVAGAALLRAQTGKRVNIPVEEGVQVAKAIENGELGTDELAHWFKAHSRASDWRLFNLFGG